MNRNVVAAALLIGLLAVFGWSPGLARAEYAYRLPEGLQVGDIDGPGREAVIRALKKHTRSGSERSVLSGRVSLNQREAAERETVALKKPSGPPYLTYKPDPFTTRLWKVEETPETLALESFDLERFTGTMVFDWRLAAAQGGAALDQGRIEVDVDRIRGGYLASQGAAPPLRGGRSEGSKLEARLAEEVVRLLTLDLGRGVSAAELESGDDSWSRRARALAGNGDWEGARKLWLEVLELNPEYGPALYNLGLYHERRKEPEEAWRYYRSAFLSEASDRHRAALTRLTETLAQAGRLPKRNARK